MSIKRITATALAFIAPQAAAAYVAWMAGWNFDGRTFWVGYWAAISLGVSVIFSCAVWEHQE